MNNYPLTYKEFAGGIKTTLGKAYKERSSRHSYTTAELCHYFTLVFARRTGFRVKNYLSESTPTNIKQQQLPKNNGNNLWALAAFDTKIVDKHMFSAKAFGTPFSKPNVAVSNVQAFP
uniref:Uncharacterized protein n=1 Tax=Glossina pallidipes TaxID=7398 RepID=A0A1A9ZIX8_GLOPL